MSTELTQDELKRLLHYNPETGIFTWKVSNSNVRSVGSIAGCPNLSGYTVIRIHGKLYRAGRLAWFYMKGVWPIEVDHENTAPGDDRWKNLREATSGQNKRNRSAYNQLSVKGVRRHHNKYVATICVNRTNIHLGSFLTIEEASAAYKKAAIKYFGEFANGD